jgi:hypothetical protein
MNEYKEINEKASEDELRNRQPRTGKSDAPSAEDVKQRLAAAHRSGPDRPLRQIAAAEAALHTRSAALAQLSGVSVPDKHLLAHQLYRSVDTSRAPSTLEPKLRRDVLQLYLALESQNATESILDRLTVAASNNAMNSYARAERTANPKAVDIHLRHAAKGTQLVINLVEAKARLRDPNRLTVRNVTVEAGGQAIVGNVEAAKKRRSEKKRRSMSSPGKGADD